MAESADQENLVCPLCLEIFEDATLLMCGHYFCRICLDNYDRCQTLQKNTIRCPLCRQETELGDNRVAGLPTNTSVNKVVEEFNDSANSLGKLYEELPRCSQCLSKPGLKKDEIYAVTFCYQCESYMCGRCQAAHEQLMTTFKNHKVVSVKEMLAGKSGTFEQLDRCPEHTSEVREFYCEDCRKIICLKCTIVKHNVRDHVIRERADFEKDIRGKIDKFEEQCDEEKKYLEGFIREVECKRRDTKRTFESLKNDIDERHSEIINRLEQRMIKIKEEVQTIQSKCNDQFDIMKATAIKMATQLSSSSELMVQGRRGGLEGDSLIWHDHLCHETEGLMQSCRTWRIHVSSEPEKVSSVASGMRFVHRDIDTTIGEVVEAKKDWHLSKEIQLPHEEPMNGLSKFSDSEVLVGYSKQMADKFNCKGERTEVPFITGSVGDVTVLSDGCVVIIKQWISPHRLSIYNAEGKIYVKRKFDIIKSRSTKSLDSDKSDKIYLAYWNEKLIHVFKREGGKPIRTIEVKVTPHQVHTSKCGWLAIRSADGVRVLSRDGQELSFIGTPKAHIPICPALDEKDSLYTAWIDQKKGRLTIKKYTLGGFYVETILDDIEIKLSKRNWYYMKCLSPDTIVLCTAGTMYIIQRQLTKPEV